MAEESSELLLQVLRQVQGDLSDLKRGVAELNATVDAGFEEVNQKVDGLTLMLTLLAGHVHHVEQRVEALETART